MPRWILVPLLAGAAYVVTCFGCCVAGAVVPTPMFVLGWPHEELTGHSGHAVAQSVDGRVAARLDRRLVVYDRSEAALVHEEELDPYAVELRFAEDATGYVYASKRDAVKRRGTLGTRICDEVWAGRLGERQRTRLTHDRWPERQPTPSGRFVWFLRPTGWFDPGLGLPWLDYELVRFEPATGAEEVVVAAADLERLGGGGELAVWGEGGRIALCGAALVAVDGNGTELMRLGAEIGGFGPCFSPSGERVAFLTLAPERGPGLYLGVAEIASGEHALVPEAGPFGAGALCFGSDDDELLWLSRTYRNVSAIDVGSGAREILFRID